MRDDIYDVICSVNMCVFSELGFCMKDVHEITPNTITCTQFKHHLLMGDTCKP